MIYKITIGLSILLASNLIVGTISPRIQAYVVGINTSTTILAMVSILTGVILGYSLRGYQTSKSQDNEEEQW